MSIQWFADKFEAKYSAHYLLNDPAHREDHFREVLDNALRGYATLMDGPASSRVAYMLVAAAYLHDLFAWSRINHHTLSAEYVRSGDCELLADFTADEREQVALMCEQHRASFKGKFSGFYAELFNAADMGPPNLKEDLTRAYKYAKAKAPERDHDYWVAVTHGHIVDKFGRNGYAKRGQLYMEVYGKNLEEYFREIELLTVGYLIFNEDSPLAEMNHG